MKSAHIFYTISLLGCLGIGALLVIKDHPYFGAIAFLISGFISFSDKD